MKMKFEKIRTTLTPESTDKEVKQLNSLIKEIKSMSKFPSDLGIGVVFTFTVYFASILLDSLQLISPSTTSFQDFVLGGLFILATLSFFSIGGNAILRIYSPIKKEFDEITKRQKELGLNDFGKGTDSVTITAELGLNDAGKGTDSVTIKKMIIKKNRKVSRVH